MTELIDLAFIDLLPDTARSLIRETITLNDGENALLEKLLTIDEDIPFSVTPRSGVLGPITVPDMSLLVLVQEGKCTLEFNWDIDPYGDERAIRIKEVHRACIAIAQRLGIEEFCAGMEPWFDEQTRYFTRSNEGPLL